MTANGALPADLSRSSGDQTAAPAAEAISRLTDDG
jgi:hypothetical protein